MAGVRFPGARFSPIRYLFLVPLMKSSMRSRLEQLSHRLIEVDALLAEPDTAADMERFRKLSRERAELEPVVQAFAQFARTEDDLATAPEKLAARKSFEWGKGVSGRE